MSVATAYLGDGSGAAHDIHPILPLGQFRNLRKGALPYIDRIKTRIRRRIRRSSMRPHPPPSTRPISLGTTKDSRRGSDGGVPSIGSGTTRSRPYAPFINQLFTLRFRQPVGRRRFPRDRSFFSRENDFTRVERERERERPPADSVSLPSSLIHRACVEIDRAVRVDYRDTRAS